MSDIDYDIFLPETESTPTLIFIHGAGGDKTQWELQRIYFQKLGWGVVTLSLPNHGNSNNIKDISILNYSKEVSKLITQLKLTQITIVGHSMGGAIALNLALSSSTNLIKSLVLIGTGAKLTVSPIFFEFIESDFNKALAFMNKYAYNKSTSNEIKTSNEEILRRSGSPVLLQDFKACNSFDIRNEISTISLPTLIICGENDMMTPCKFSTFMHEKIINSELSIVSNAGHFVFLECPNEVNEVIKDFFIR